MTWIDFALPLILFGSGAVAGFVSGWQGFKLWLVYGYRARKALRDTAHDYLSD